MRIFSLLILSFISLFAQPQPQTASRPPQQQPPPAEVKPEDKCSIEGTILNGVTGEPLPKANVLLRSMDQTNGIVSPYGATSDSGGHYVIRGIDPGRYSLTAQRNGFVPSSYGAKPGTGRMSAGTILNLTAKSSQKNLDVKLGPQGVVTGRVADEDGEPLANVQVRAMRSMYVNGKRNMMSAGNSSTNDKGEYRMFGIAPGKYLISAIYRDPSYGGEIRQENDSGDYASVYYPSTTSVQTAMGVDVVAGREISGIDLRLTRQKLPRVSGFVSGMAVNRTRYTQVVLAPREAGSFGYEGMKNAMVDQKGRFTIRGVMPGKYSITAMADDGGERRFAYTTLEVTTQSVEDVQLAFGPSMVVSGSFRVEGRQDLGSLKTTNIRLFLNPQDGSLLYGGNQTTLKDDGTFEAKGYAPGRYRINLYPMPDGYYIKAVRMGSTEVSEPMLDLSGGAPPEVVITMSERAANVQGVVELEKDKPAGGAMVVLVPDDREKSTLFQSAPTDQTGHFNLKSVPPGSYKLFAWENAEVGAWQDPEFLKLFEQSGTSVTLSEGSQETKNLRVLQAPAN